MAQFTCMKMYLSCLSVSPRDWLRGDGRGDDAAGIASHCPAVVVARHGDPGDIGQLARGLLEEVVLVLVLVILCLVGRDLQGEQCLARVLSQEVERVSPRQVFRLKTTPKKVFSTAIV